MRAGHGSTTTDCSACSWGSTSRPGSRGPSGGRRTVRPAEPALVVDPDDLMGLPGMRETLVGMCHFVRAMAFAEMDDLVSAQRALLPVFDAGIPLLDLLALAVGSLVDAMCGRLQSAA